MKNLRIVDLFAGTGAFSYAFHNPNRDKIDININTVFANDILDSSEEIYNINNFGVKLTKLNLNEIKNEDIPEFLVSKKVLMMNALMYFGKYYQLYKIIRQKL
jgi:site-specific DNA-cytosine methylase